MADTVTVTAIVPLETNAWLNHLTTASACPIPASTRPQTASPLIPLNAVPPPTVVIRELCVFRAAAARIPHVFLSSHLVAQTPVDLLHQ